MITMQRCSEAAHVGVTNGLYSWRAAGKAAEHAKKQRRVDDTSIILI
jgi:hypothetical protein